MTTALLFPGQGIDVAAVASEWHARSAHARALIHEAADATGIAPAQLLHGAGAAVRRTEAYQPVMTAISLAALLEAREAGVSGTIVAGHSLGELAACVAAGAIMPGAAVRLAAERGRLMAREASLHPGGMVAIRARTRADVETLVARLRAQGALDLASHNAPDEWVLSGSREALAAVPAEFAPVPLATDGPWHSSAMAGAEAGYRQALERALERAPQLPLVCNRTGELASGDLAPILAGQLTRPIEWVRTLETLWRCGARTFVTVGPAKVLRSLVRRTLGAPATLVPLDEPRDLARLARALPAA